MNNILITGGSGFVGQNIIEVLRAQRPDLHIYNFARTPVNVAGVTNLIGDATDFQESKLDANFKYIINLLALSNDKYCENFEIANQINVDFSRKIFEFAKKQNGLRKIIHLSSIIIYDKNTTPPVKETDKIYLDYTNYSFTKGISDLYANYYADKFNLPIITFRLSNIYGPYQNFENSPFLVPSKIVQAITDGKITVDNLKPKRDWIYSADAALGICAALDSNFSGTLNLASGYGISVEEIIMEISKQLQVNYQSNDRSTNGPVNFYCDISKIKSILDWEPKTPLADGIQKTISYIRSNLAKK